MIAKDFVPPWARGDFDYYQVVSGRSITLYGTHPRGRPTSPGSSQPAKERGRRAIPLVESVQLPGALTPYPQGWTASGLVGG